MNIKTVNWVTGIQQVALLQSLTVWCIGTCVWNSQKSLKPRSHIEDQFGSGLWCEERRLLNLSLALFSQSQMTLEEHICLILKTWCKHFNLHNRANNTSQRLCKQCKGGGILKNFPLSYGPDPNWVYLEFKSKKVPHDILMGELELWTGV